MSEETVRTYYEAIDTGDYDRFADLLAPGVVHERPDRTIEGRETLVGFMRDDRPNKDTSHVVEAVYRATETHDEAKDEPETTPAAADRADRGRLLDADGEPMFAFVDAFEVQRVNEDGDESQKIARIRTYTR